MANRLDDGASIRGVDPARAPVPALLHETTLLLFFGLVWTSHGIWYASLGRTLTASLDGGLGLITLGLAIWARLRPQDRRRAWDIAVVVAAIGLVAAAILSGHTRAMAGWFLVVIPPVAAYQRGVRSAKRWAVVVTVLLLAVHLSESYIPVEPEFIASGFELFAAQVAMVVMVVGFGVSVRRSNEVGERRLAESNARLQALVDNIELGVAVTDPGGRIVLINPVAREMLGVGERAEVDVVGTRTVDLFRRRMDALGLDSRPQVAEMHQLVQEGQKTLGDELELPNGVVYERDYLPIHLPDGEVGHMWTFRDISDRKAMERMKGQFLSTISHELRTPLTAIQGSLRLVESQVAGELPAKVRELLEIAGSHTEHLEGLIGDLLDLQEIHAGKLNLHPDLCSLAPLIDEASGNVSRGAEKAQVRFDFVCPPDVVVHGDGQRLTQVLTILLSNAVKFSPRGGTVTVRVSSDPTSVRVSVSDEGPGIPADGLEQIFERFQQLDATDARPKGGTGLGLAIAKAIVDGHGGRIGVDSHLGAGATFWIELAGEQSPQHAPLASA